VLALACTAAINGPEASGSAGSIVRVTAVVTNARGEAVRGLQASDFQVTVDGTPQALETSEFRNSGPETRRVVAFVLDEFHVDAAQSDAVRAALIPFLDSYVRPGDLTLVFKPLDPLASIRPTEDTQAAREAIASFAGRKGDYTPRTAFEEKYMAQAPNAVIPARAQIVSAALRAVASRLGEVRNARPAIVLVSDGFARQRADRSAPANLLSAVRVANRGDVPVYVFAPTPLPVAAPGETAQIEPAQVALQTMAAQTGGDFNAGLATFANGLARMIRELEAHYVLTYQPQHGDDGRFHAVQVSLKRPDVRVRARTGYVAPMSAELRAAAAAPIVPARALRRSVFIQGWSGISRSAEGKPRVTFTWEPVPPPPGAVRPSAAVLVVTAKTSKGEVLFDGTVGAVGAAVPAEGANRAEFEAPAGRIQLDARVLDAKGVVLDSDARDVDVPNLHATRATILSPAVLRSASERDFRAITSDPDAPPVPGRDFRRTERLLLRVPAFEAGGEPARVSATLLNRWRQPMRALPAMPESPRPGITQFDIPLAPLAPGEYTIRLSAGQATEHVTFRVRG
jgi:VWFA-related protein